MEDGTISCISNAYSPRLGRRQPPTLEVKELKFVIVDLGGSSPSKEDGNQGKGW
jgi:hypothetical protein